MSRLKVVHPRWAVLNIHHYSMAHALHQRGVAEFHFCWGVFARPKKWSFHRRKSASVCFSQLDNSRLTMERLHVWRFFLRVLKKRKYWIYSSHFIAIYCLAYIPWLIEGPLPDWRVVVQLDKRNQKLLQVIRRKAVIQTIPTAKLVSTLAMSNIWEVTLKSCVL